MATILECSVCESTVGHAAALPGETVFACDCDTTLEVTEMTIDDLRDALPSKWTEQRV